MILLGHQGLCFLIVSGQSIWPGPRRTCYHKGLLPAGSQLIFQKRNITHVWPEKPVSVFGPTCLNASEPLNWSDLKDLWGSALYCSSKSLVWSLNLAPAQMSVCWLQFCVRSWTLSLCPVPPASFYLCVLKSAANSSSEEMSLVGSLKSLEGSSELGLLQAQQKIRELSVTIRMKEELIKELVKTGTNSNGTFFWERSVFGKSTFVFVLFFSI